MNLSEREREILRNALSGPGTKADQRRAFNAATGRDMDREHFRRAVKRQEVRVEVEWDPSEYQTASSGDTGIQSSKIRLIVPDSHGCFASASAVKVLLDNIELLDPKEVVLLGDHVDVSGLFSAHPNNYLSDMEYSYEADCAAANGLLDAIQKRAPGADYYYLEGNHEAHYQRWVSRTHHSVRDAVGQVEVLAPEAKLRLKERGIRYFKSSETYDGLSTPGLMKRGKCYFTHGFNISKHATAAHVAAVGACVVHGHTHRAQSYLTRTVASDVIGGWCPGTLSDLQPLYRHNSPTEWTHGFAIQAYETSGEFLHVNVPIVGGRSFLRPLLGAIKPQHLYG